MRSIQTKEHNMSKRLIKLLPVAAALALSGLANAATPQDLPSVIVKYGDLNLNTQAGIKNLHSRLRYAAEQVCSPLNSRVLGLRDQYEQCVSDAVAQSVAEVGNPNLSNFHRYGGRAGFVASN
jgi:UrcA family protein